MATLIDIIGLPEAVKEKVTICGVEFAVGEWPLKYHAMWNKLIGERGLDRAASHMRYVTIPELSMVQKQVEADPRVNSLTKRINAIEAQEDIILKTYGTKKQRKDADEQLSALLVQKIPLAQELEEVGRELEARVLEKMIEADHETGELKELQDDLRLEFAHTVALAESELDEGLDDWRARARVEDFTALERWIKEGNGPWAERAAQMMQEQVGQTRNAPGTRSESSASRRASRLKN